MEKKLLSLLYTKGCIFVIAITSSIFLYVLFFTPNAIFWFFMLFFWEQKNLNVQFTEAECVKIDAQNRKIYCRSKINNLNGTEEFAVDYDYLVLAVGANVNTFNTPGVEEHCHFLKVTPSSILSIFRSPH